MPAPFTYTRYDIRPLDITFEGEHVVLKQAGTYPLQDACQTLRFVNAIKEQTGEGVKDHTDEGFEALQQQCTAQGDTPPSIESPVPAPDIPDPSATDSPNPDPHGTETPQSLGAPAPPVSGNFNGESRPAGTSDDRPLAQQYFSPVNPMPIYDVNDQLFSQGVAPDDLDDAINRISHNE